MNNKSRKIKSLRQKITFHSILIGTFAIVVTTLLTIFVYYSMFRHQIFEDLRVNAKIVETMLHKETFQSFTDMISNEHIRITIIDEEGNVSYDNDAKASVMENHRERPEIKKAFKSGSGTSVRHSNTMNQNTYYYAVLLSDGHILRVAKEARGMMSVFYNTIPLLCIGVFILLAICIIMSRLLTKGIIRPIQQMSQNMSEIEELRQDGMYEELQPFTDRIYKQHQDITQQLRELEKSGKIRQEFTANVSHELKTPLTSICGYAELIENHMCEEKDVTRFGEEIKKNANRLLTLINDIIELSELDILDEQVNKTELDLYAIAKKCYPNLMISAKRHQIALKLIGETAYVYANADMMEELIVNLCDNAIRYNRPNGSVMITITPGKNETQLSVKDTGIGIPKEYQERVFERFYRVDKSRSKATGGTGLGLAIVKHIVAIHGEKISLESEVDVGTTITVWIENKKKEELPSV